MKVLTLFKGRLTYTIAAVSLLWAVFGYFKGYIDGATAFEVVLGGLAVFGVRRAIN